MKYILLGIIKLYKLTLSKILPPCCRFYPTCSVYAMTAIRRFGAVRGGYLTLWRLFRCNPFANEGVDPVPEKFRFRPEKYTVSRPIDKAVNCAECYQKRHSRKRYLRRRAEYTKPII